MDITNTLRLKTRLKLKFIQREIDAQVRENFGYDPHTPAFESLLDERARWEGVAREGFPDIYREHYLRAYCS